MSGQMSIANLRIKKPLPFDEEAIEIFSELVPNPQGKIAIVDGDVMCYHACPPRPRDNMIALDEDGNRLPPVYTAEEDELYIEQSWENLNNNLNNLADKLYCDDIIVAVAGRTNFRSLLFPDYKVHRHRKPGFSNIAVPILRKRVVQYNMGVTAEGMEADDLLRIWSNQARAIGQEFIICSVDKDLLCIPGEHYLMHKGKEQVVQIDDFMAARHYHEQLLKGDPTDNIPGVAGIGPKKAEKLLDDCKTIEEMQRVVVDVYKAVYLDDWYNMLIINGKLIHILAHPGDSFTLDNWSAAQD